MDRMRGKTNARTRMEGDFSRERIEDVVCVARQRGLNAAEYIRDAVYETLTADLNLTREELDIVGLSEGDKYLLTKLVAKQEGLDPWEYIVRATKMATWRDLYCDTMCAGFAFQRTETAAKSWC